MAWGPTVLWAAALFFLSALPGGTVAERVIFNDKVAHAAAYSLLGAALAWGRHRSHGRPGDAWLLLAGALYGLSDEFHQMHVPGRSADPADFAADVVGLLLGYGTTRAVLGRRTDRHGPAGTQPEIRQDAS